MTGCEQAVAAYKGSVTDANYATLYSRCGEARQGMGPVAAGTVHFLPSTPIHPPPVLPFPFQILPTLPPHPVRLASPPYTALAFIGMIARQFIASRRDGRR